MANPLDGVPEEVLDLLTAQTLMAATNHIMELEDRCARLELGLVAAIMRLEPETRNIVVGRDSIRAALDYPVLTMQRKDGRYIFALHTLDEAKSIGGIVEGLPDNPNPKAEVESVFTDHGITAD